MSYLEVMWKPTAGVSLQNFGFRVEILGILIFSWQAGSEVHPRHLRGVRVEGLRGASRAC
jgi:hypothetical protein